MYKFYTHPVIQNSQHEREFVNFPISQFIRLEGSIWPHGKRVYNFLIFAFCTFPNVGEELNALLLCKNVLLLNCDFVTCRWNTLPSLCLESSEED